MSEMPALIPSPSYELDGRRVVAIGDGALTVLERFRQCGARDTEAGGILLGRIIQVSGDIVIDVAGEPSGNDERSRFRFFRKRDAAQKRVSQEWEQSDGTRIYLGEWHTHPELVPTPSCLDRREWRRLTVETRYEQDRLLFVIVGTACTRVWSLRRGERGPRELRARTDQLGSEFSSSCPIEDEDHRSAYQSASLDAIALPVNGCDRDEHTNNGSAKKTRGKTSGNEGRGSLF